MFDYMDGPQIIRLLEGYSVGPRMLRLIESFWDLAVMVYHSQGNNGQPFKTGCGMTKGGLLSMMLFNILVDTVVCEWL